MDRSDSDEMHLNCRWRTGRSVGRTIYAVRGGEPEDDPLIGTMDSQALAERVVQVHNRALAMRKEGT